MTTPPTTDPYPGAPGASGNISNIAALLGVGAYTIDDSSDGSGLNFGQDVTGEDFVKNFVYSTAMQMGPGDGSISSAVTNLGTFLNTMSLDALKLLQPFIPGATDDQFSDTSTAVTTILAQFNVQLMMSLQAFQQWLDDIFNPNSYLWADAKAWWDTLFAQLNSYPASGSSAATVATWWSTLFVDLGLDPTLSATVANVISGNYDWAKEAAANWDTFLTAIGLNPTQIAAAIAASTSSINAFLASIGLGSMTAAGAQLSGNNTSIATQLAWWNSVATALWVSLDWFHVVYPLGSPSDTATTTSGGKMTWYASQAALKALFTTIGATPAAVAHVDIGGVIQGTQAAVSSGITGDPTGGAPDNTVVQTAVSGLSNAVAGLQTQVAGLQSTAASPTTILRDTGQDSPGSGLGSNWTRTQTAAVNRSATKGFMWSPSGAVSRTCVGVYNTPLATADQVGTIILNQAMQGNGFDPVGNPYAFGAAENWILLRVNSPSSPTSWVGARIRYADVQFGYLSGGVITMLGSPVAFPAGSATSYTFYAGDDTSDYNYKLVSAGRTIATYADSAHATSGSLAGLYPGQIWKSAAGNFDITGTAIETNPASTSWIGYDASASAGVPIGYGHVYRNSATGVSTSGFPLWNFFDTTVALGSGISLPTSGNSGFIVATAGLYTFGYGLVVPSLSGTVNGSAAIHVNGTIVEKGESSIYTGGGVITNYRTSMTSAGLLLQAGDLVGGTNPFNNIAGESGGAGSYMKIAKIG